MIQNAKKKLKNNHGYSLAELLIVVGIIAILAAISVVSLITIQRNIRQQELDQKAQTIYMATQNRLSSLYASGLESVYECNGSNGVMKIGNVPGDALEEDNITSDTIVFMAPGMSATNTVITSDVLSSDLLNEHWIIEYNPQNATVYAVYYSEGDFDVSIDYKTNIINGSLQEKYLDTMRVLNNRKKDGAKVGYYGGGGAGGNKTTTLTPSIKIENGEKLQATIKCTKPMNVTSDLVFQVIVSDNEGNAYTQYFTEGKSIVEGNEEHYDVDFKQLKRVGRNYTLSLTLDDLSSESTRFHALYGEDSHHNDNIAYQNKGELVSGTELKVEVYVLCPGDYTVDQNGYASVITNSLFADDSNEYIDHDHNTTAILMNGRHLQNLDASSRVNENIVYAKQENNISFIDDIKEDTDWYSTYKDYFFNGFTSMKPNFKSIQNNNLKSIIGLKQVQNDEDIQYRIIGLTSQNSNGNAGLFEEVENDFVIQNIILTGETIHASNSAGGFIGCNKGNVMIQNSQIYLSESDGDLENIDESIRWINGKNAGGLVGENTGTLNIENSSASTVLGNTISGGFVGNNSSNVSIQRSYVDSYIFGNYAGGFIGNSTGKVDIQSSYNAGFIGLTNSSSVGAGFVNGNVSTLKNSYTLMACYRQGNNGRIKKTSGKVDADSGTYYSSAKAITDCSNVYYFMSGTKDNNISNTSAMNGKSASSLLSDLGKDFSIITNGTQPYNLMNQSLKTYTYPRIASLNHYGDWEAEFQSGAFVYFEVYKDNDTYSYGFDGGNIDSSLSNTKMLVGDGYGVVLKDKDSLPDSITITINGNKTEIFIQNNTNYYKTTVNGVIYRIYPVNTKTVKPGTSFYDRVEVSQTMGLSTTKTYYDYNPNFAKTVLEVSENEKASTLSKTTILSIRSSRQLYALSSYYETSYKDLPATITFRQERNIDYAMYEWSSYHKDGSSTIKEQQPIGQTYNSAFKQTYNGGCFQISNVSFKMDKGQYLGMFGYNKGSLKNIVLSCEYNEEAPLTVKRNQVIGVNETVYFGVLAGYNTNVISNCAVSGYSLTGSNGAIHAYPNSTVYVGNLVGRNDGTISNSSADCPKLTVSATYAHSYLAGFVGYNAGTIKNAYALGQVEAADSTGGSTILAGFVSRNTGTIIDSYCATSLTAGGETTTVYGFVPNGGTIKDCFYLNGGSYSYVDVLYNYNNSNSRGLPKTYGELKNMVNHQAKYSYNHMHTNENKYPYEAVVKDAKGNYVHYGDWQLQPSLGTVGVFYWECEDEGSNNGYKFTYIGTSENQVFEKTNLCVSHDDGGRITEYGYGYFLLKGMEENVSLSTKDLEISGNKVNQEAKANLEAQVSGYTFYPFTTRDSKTDDYILLSGSNPNGTMTLNYKNGNNVVTSYNFTISPFFANSIQYAKATPLKDLAGNTKNYAANLGTSQNQYEIRSAKQLQFMNWNFNTKNTTTVLNQSNYSSEYKNFTYLGSVNGNSKNNKNLSFIQSHDVDAKMSKDGSNRFTPIGSILDDPTFGFISNCYIADFDGTYNGQSYKISNVEIESDSNCVGLFGMTIDAKLQNIILYSENGNHISTNPNGSSWYSIGGLVGLAAQGDGTKAEVSNCAVAGYTIMDVRKDDKFGGANVGGLIGMSNLNTINQCSAVTNIEIRATYSNNNRTIRAGGLIGCLRGTVSNSYVGGTLINYMNNNTNVDAAAFVGGSTVTFFGNLEQSAGKMNDYVKINNSYSYMKIYNKGKAYSKLSPVGQQEDERILLWTTKIPLTATNVYYIDNWNQTPKTNYYNTSGISKTYEELSNDSMASTLGTAWSNVTTKDSGGGDVSGKYSFSCGNTTLNGKDYPFPTILKQREAISSQLVNVHYGEWPLNGVYWEKARDTIDIFEKMDENGDVFVTYNLQDTNNLLSNPNKVDFEMDEDIVEIDSINEKQKDSGTYYEVVFKVKNTGATTIFYQDASFVLDVEANLNVSVEPSILYCRPGQSQDVSVVAMADDKDYSNKVQWSITDQSEKCDITQVSTTTFRITGYGYESPLDVTYHYDFHGVDLYQSNGFEVIPVNVLGLSNGISYNEIDVMESHNEGVNTDYTNYIAPSLNDFFLYENLETNVLETNSISEIIVEDDLGVHEVLKDGQTNYDSYYVSFDEVETQEIYQYRKGTIYHIEGGQSNDVSVSITINGYTFHTTLSVVEHADMSSITLKVDDNTTILPLIQDSEYTLPTMEQTKTGYKFMGWEDENGIIYQPNQKVIVNNQVFSAKWQANAYVVSFDEDSIDCVYDQVLSIPEPEQYENKVFLGWKLGDTLYQPQDEYIVHDHVNFESVWGYKLELLDIDGSIQEVILQQGDDSLKEYEPLSFNSELLGWYDKASLSGTKMIEADGTISNDIQKNMRLYACRKLKGYAKVDSFSNGNFVLSNETNALNNNLGVSTIEKGSYKDQNDQTVEYVITPSNVVWTVSASGSNFNLKNGSKYLNGTNALSTSNTAKNIWNYSKTSKTVSSHSVINLYNTSGYNLHYNGTSFKLIRDTDSNVSIYKEQDVYQFGQEISMNSMMTAKGASPKAQVDHTPLVSIGIENVYYDENGNPNAYPFAGETKLEQKTMSFYLDDKVPFYEVSIVHGLNDAYTLVEKNDLEEDKGINDTYAWYTDVNEKKVVWKQEGYKTQHVSYIYVEKAQSGYDVFMDSSDQRIHLSQNKNSNLSKNGYFVGHIEKNDYLSLPFVEMNNNQQVQSYLVYRKDGFLTVITNDTKQTSNFEQIAVQAKFDNQESKIKHVQNNQIHVINQKEEFKTNVSIKDMLNGTELSIPSSKPMLLKVMYEENNNLRESYISSSYRNSKNTWKLDEELLSKAKELQFLEFDKEHYVSAWSKPYEFDESLMEKINGDEIRYSGGSLLGYPTFDKHIWNDLNVYRQLPGQCTWFAWARFYEIYGYSPGFTGNGYECVSQLLKAHPGEFESGKTPVPGSVFSADAMHNHVGIIVDVNGDTITIQEGNLDGITNYNWDDAIKDWQQITYSLSTLYQYYGNVTFANPIHPPVVSKYSSSSAIGSTIKVQPVQVETKPEVAVPTPSSKPTVQENPVKEEIEKEIPTEPVEYEEPVEMEEIEELEETDEIIEEMEFE